MILKKGTLWQALTTTTERALGVGALLPVPTDYTFVEDRGIRFFVRILSNLERKDEARKKQEAESKTGKNANPFLPPEKELTVAGISSTHLAVLNKFNVVDHHLLIITRHFEDQETLLTLQDFEALWLCMAEYDGLGFYNGGREAGASQRHKHLQMIPLPMAPEGPAVPLEPLLDRVNSVDSPRRVAGFPFLHSFVRLRRNIVDTPCEAARDTFALYRAMLTSVGMKAPVEGSLTSQSIPYCLLLTRKWMLLVPRSKECFEDISFNALAFAGGFLVRNVRQFERLKATGPLNALGNVAVFQER